MERSSRAALSESDGHFAHAVELFNAGRYFESHEVWERLWLRAAGTDRLLLQGLIQAAAAMLHLERGNLRGARSLVGKSWMNLANAPDRFMGVSLVGFAKALESYASAAEVGDSSTARPILYRASSNQP
jgi:predicted metal-dependent hydrolase